MRWTFITVLAIALITFILSANVYACDCVGPSGRKAITNESVAFRGTVKSIEYLEERSSAVKEPRIAVTFLVSRVWNGSVTRTFTLHTIENSWSCAGYHFVKDREYVVVAYRHDETEQKAFKSTEPVYGTNPCGATKPIELAKQELIDLGKGWRPRKNKKTLA